MSGVDVVKESKAMKGTALFLTALVLLGLPTLDMEASDAQVGTPAVEVRTEDPEIDPAEGLKKLDSLALHAKNDCDSRGESPARAYQQQLHLLADTATLITDTAKRAEVYEGLMKSWAEIGAELFSCRDERDSWDVGVKITALEFYAANFPKMTPDEAIRRLHLGKPDKELDIDRDGIQEKFYFRSGYWTTGDNFVIGRMGGRLQVLRFGTASHTVIDRQLKLRGTRERALLLCISSGKYSSAFEIIGLADGKLKVLFQGPSCMPHRMASALDIRDWGGRLEITCDQEIDYKYLSFPVRYRWTGRGMDDVTLEDPAFLVGYYTGIKDRAERRKCDELMNNMSAAYARYHKPLDDPMHARENAYRAFWEKYIRPIRENERITREMYALPPEEMAENVDMYFEVDTAACIGLIKHLLYEHGQEEACLRGVYRLAKDWRYVSDAPTAVEIFDGYLRAPITLSRTSPGKMGYGMWREIEAGTIIELARIKALYDCGSTYYQRAGELVESFVKDHAQQRPYETRDAMEIGAQMKRLLAASGDVRKAERNLPECALVRRFESVRGYGGGMVVVESEGKLLGIVAGTGATMWTVDADALGERGIYTSETFGNILVVIDKGYPDRRGALQSIHALDMVTGSLKWSWSSAGASSIYPYRRYGGYLLTPMSVSGLFGFRYSDKPGWSLCVLDTANGEAVFCARGEEIFGITEHYAVIKSERNEVKCYRLKDGKVLWSRASMGFFPDKVFEREGMLWVQAFSQLAALYPETGQTRWCSSAPEYCSTCSEGTIVRGDRVLFRGGSNTLLALNAQTGATVWTWMSERDRMVTSGGSVLFAGPWGKSLFCCNLDGKLHWRLVFDQGIPIRNLYGLDQETTAVYLNDGTLRILRNTDGKELYKLKSDFFPYQVFRMGAALVCWGEDSLCIYAPGSP